MFFSELYDKSVTKFARSVSRNCEFIEYLLFIDPGQHLRFYPFFRINAVMFVPIFFGAADFFSPAALI